MIEIDPRNMANPKSIDARIVPVSKLSSEFSAPAASKAHISLVLSLSVLSWSVFRFSPHLDKLPWIEYVRFSTEVDL